MDTVEEIIRNHPFWKGINPRYFYILRQCATYVRWGIGQNILTAGIDAKHFYLIHQGRVALEAFVPGKGTITFQTIGPGEALGWSWLFPPYCWHFSARSVDVTEAVCFGARGLLDYAQENHDFGYALAMRVGQILLQRLQATRLQLIDFYNVPGE